MHAGVTIRLPSGEQVMLGHGDLIGRVWSAVLQVEDPRISEAHAMVSLRGDQLVLLALRGRFQIDGKVLGEAVLAQGQTIWLTPDHPLEVVGVDLPLEGLALSASGMSTQLLAGTCALVVEPVPAVVARGDKRALAHVWFGVRQWWVRPIGAAAQPLEAGTALELGEVVFTAECVPVGSGAAGATVAEGGLEAPMHVVARFDTVHIYRPGTEPVAIDGQGARILSELVAFDGPVPWRLLATQLWRDDEDEHRLRKRLDIAMLRLRRRLAELKIRTNLVRATGRGMYELFLLTADRVEDRT